MIPTFNSQGYVWVDTLPTMMGIGGRDRFVQVLESWRDTPYQSGAQRKGLDGGADCARFGCGLLDEMYRVKRTPASIVPDDTQFHDRRRTMRAVSWMRHEYPSVRVRGLKLHPADLVIVGPKLGGMGHLMIVGPRRNTLWHCNRGIGVKETGLAFEAQSQVVKAVYRLLELERWAA